MDIRKLRKELLRWGRFWHKQEQIGGYASRSNIDRLKEACEVGGWISSDLHLFEGSSQIKVPDEIASTTKLIERLKLPYRLALIGKYKNNMKGDSLKSWTNQKSQKDVQNLILHAENTLLSMLS